MTDGEGLHTGQQGSSLFVFLILGQDFFVYFIFMHIHVGALLDLKIFLKNTTGQGHIYCHNDLMNCI